MPGEVDARLQHAQALARLGRQDLRDLKTVRRKCAGPLCPLRALFQPTRQTIHQWSHPGMRERTMLDTNMKAQLQGYLERITQPVEIVASLDDSDQSREMLELLNDIE